MKHQKTTAKRVTKEMEAAKKRILHLCAKHFSCESDAKAALSQK